MAKTKQSNKNGGNGLRLKDNDRIARGDRPTYKCKLGKAPNSLKIVEAQTGVKKLCAGYVREERDGQLVRESANDTYGLYRKVGSGWCLPGRACVGWWSSDEVRKTNTGKRG